MMIVSRQAGDESAPRPTDPDTHGDGVIEPAGQSDWVTEPAPQSDEVTESAEQSHEAAEPAPQPQAPRGRRHGLDLSERPDRQVLPRFDFSGLMRRARRNARMSQRAMAEAIGVGKSTIGDAERDGGSVSLPVLLAVLAVGGIDLVAVDGDGEVEIMRLDALRDRRNRKLPAHRHAWVASEAEYVPEGWQGSGRRNAPVRWSLRPSQADLAYLPLHHPGPDDLISVRRRDADVQAFRRARLAALRRAVPSRFIPLPECTCSDQCVQMGMACPPTCPCQCEGPADLAV